MKINNTIKTFIKILLFGKTYKKIIEYNNEYIIEPLEFSMSSVFPSKSAENETMSKISEDTI